MRHVDRTFLCWTGSAVCLIAADADAVSDSAELDAVKDWNCALRASGHEFPDSCPSSSKKNPLVERVVFESPR